MKRTITFSAFSFIVLVFLSCNSETTTTKPSIDYSKYPEALQRVFVKHGGLDNWQKQMELSYDLVKESGDEHHIIHLKDRRGRIDAPNFQIGHDGEQLWVVADTSYKGNAAFYHNLMFYFYAMPFVLADDGIVYSETEPITFENKIYPGVKISYQDSVGISPKDEYILHYDAETFQMTWLGYTATYFSQEKKKDFSWIRYDDWSDFNGLLLPNSLTWYKVEEGQRTEPRSTRTFKNIKISEVEPSDSLFTKREGAIVMEY